MVCLGNMCMDNLHKGDNDDDDNDNNNDNNNNVLLLLLLLLLLLNTLKMYCSRELSSLLAVLMTSPPLKFLFMLCN